MQTYILLQKLTEEGIKSIKDAPQRIEQNVKRLEAAGGKLIGFYAVMGEYDYVSIVEVPSEEVGLNLLLWYGSSGIVRNVTLRAFKQQEFIEAVKKL